MRQRRISGCLLVLAGLCATSRAQSPDEQIVHWAYAPYLGTGSYRFSDASDIFALRLAKRWTLREAAIEDDGTRRIGLDVRLPITIGAERNRYQSIADAFAPGNVSTLSAVPGVEIEVPLGERVSLKPIVYGGWGTELGGGDSSFIYWTGLKSRVAFHSGNLDWWLIQSLQVVGFSSREAPSESLLPLKTGFEFRRPLGSRQLGGDPLYLDWSIAYTHHLDRLEFRVGAARVPSLVIDNEWELALAFSKGDKRLKLWRLQFERVGLAYRFGEGGDFAGIGLIFRSLFDR
jgi:hypothetical protein